MKYYIGYFNKPWDKTEVTVICATPNRAAASFILSKYQESTRDKDRFVMLSVAEIMDNN